jgi:hypothetical protein
MPNDFFIYFLPNEKREGTRRINLLRCLFRRFPSIKGNSKAPHKTDFEANPPKKQLMSFYFLFFHAVLWAFLDVTRLGLCYPERRYLVPPATSPFTSPPCVPS